jgi:hypothetical protein
LAAWLGDAAASVEADGSDAEELSSVKPRIAICMANKLPWSELTSSEASGSALNWLPLKRGAGTVAGGADAALAFGKVGVAVTVIGG